MKEQSNLPGNPATKKCHTCGREKPLADFGRDLTTPDGYKYVCRACRRSEYRKLHGGTAHALRNFTTAELVDEVLNRKAADAVLEKMDVADIRRFLQA